MKKKLLFIFLLAGIVSLQAQENSNQTFETTIECEDVEMFHESFATDFFNNQDDYIIGSLPEGDYISEMYYSSDGSKIFIINSYTNNITVLDANSTLLENISVGDYPITLAMNDNYLVVPCTISSDVYIIDLSDYSIAAIIDVNGKPVSIVIQDNKAYVGCDTDNYYDDECAIIDLQTLSLENTITNFPVKLTSFTYTFNNGRTLYSYNNFAVSNDGEYLIAGNWTDKINFYNTTTGEIDFEFDAEEVKRVAKSGDGTKLIAIGKKDLYQVDIDNHSVIGSINIGSLSTAFPYWGVANFEGTKAFVSLSGNQSAFIDFTSSTISTISQTKTPNWIKTSPDHSKIISGQYNFTILDFETQEILGQHIGFSSQRGSVSPDLTKAIALSFNKYEGIFFYNLEDFDNITLESYTPSGEAPEGDAPMRIRLTPTEDKALIINELSHNLSIFDIETKTFTAYIQLDGAPMDMKITSDGNYAVIATGYLKSEIVIVDINAGTIVKDITAGSSLLSIEILPDNSKAYVRDYSNGIFVVNLDGAASNLETSIPCGNSSYWSYGFSVTSGMKLTPNGEYLFVGSVSSDEFQIIDTETDEIVGQVPSGSSPYFIAFNETGDKAIAPDPTDNTYSLVNVDGANSTIIETFDVAGAKPFRVSYNNVKDEMGVIIYGDEANDEGGQLLTVDANNGEEISIVEYNETGAGNAMQALYDNEGNAIVLTEYKLFYGEENYDFPVKVKYMDYSATNSIALVISPVNDYLYVVDLTSTNIEAYPINIDNSILSQNRPNPATNSTTINYILKEDGKVHLSVYNSCGKIMQQYNNGYQEKGDHNLVLDLSTYKPGTYYYTLTVNNQSQTKKMVIVE